MRTAPLLLMVAAIAAAQSVETARVVSKTVEQKVRLPGEFLPFEAVDLHARVLSYVDKVLVDRGSLVEKGQVLVRLNAPELTAQLAEQRSKEQTAISQRAEAEARLAAAQSTFDRLKSASQTPGAVAGNELIQAEKTVDAARAAVTAAADAVRAAHSAVQASEDLQKYLTVTAPFSGVITERMIHPGALVGPGGPQDSALLHLEMISHLRLVVAVPEAAVAGIIRGAHVAFTVPAYPGEMFHGTLARVSHSVDQKTRTMSVELDVQNPGDRLAPGMFPDVNWPVHRARPSLFVPATSVVTTAERTFVIRVENGRAQWVDVRRGIAAGDQVEIIGALSPGDVIVKRASDEIRDGSPIRTT